MQKDFQKIHFIKKRIEGIARTTSSKPTNGYIDT
jgi:hypothetical protein